MRKMPSEYHRRVLENHIKHKGFADDVSAYLGIFASREAGKVGAKEAYSMLRKYFADIDTGEVNHVGMANMIDKFRANTVSFADDVDLKHNPHDAVSGQSESIKGARKCAAMAQMLVKEFDAQEARQLAKQASQDIERIDSAVEYLKTIELPEPKTLEQTIESFFSSAGYSELDDGQALGAQKHNNLKLG